MSETSLSSSYFSESYVEALVSQMKALAVKESKV